MEQTNTIYNNIYDVPKMEFRLEDDGKKACYKCKHYGCLINQGYWWCNLQLDMDAEHCEACDTSLYDNAITTYNNNYELAVSMWNLNNPDSYVIPKTNSEGETIIPNYTTIKPYKDAVENTTEIEQPVQPKK